MNGYKVEIKEASKELSAKERIWIKDTTTAHRLDELTKEGKIKIDIDFYAVLTVHNENSKDNKDYENYILVDKEGEKYLTGSESFFNAFMSIYEEMAGEEEDWSIVAYRMPSKNYSGKDFLTCSIA